MQQSPIQSLVYRSIEEIPRDLDQLKQAKRFTLRKAGIDLLGLTEQPFSRLSDEEMAEAVFAALKAHDEKAGGAKMNGASKRAPVTSAAPAAEAAPPAPKRAPAAAKAQAAPAPSAEPADNAYLLNALGELGKGLDTIISRVSDVEARLVEQRRMHEAQIGYLQLIIEQMVSGDREAIAAAVEQASREVLPDLVGKAQGKKRG